ncbi:chromosome segregation ATPase SMC [Citrifermentans bemidjiense Bem]|uniref:Chromosome partition protein Smc n=1 Tax=Citrifermentans bemidjiense (strain ATCC BAA-1014 / DSM 16622 / JCM 12645 / Bem) TaxID=404380 RepID=B5EFS9_CITBB|nr:chromosome segregation protein SMC [Citrifermentans bemidjiense]ACH37983.1 chromosome segregation ATPase SMC [Citrifermentans bemidjiense Bem]
MKIKRLEIHGFKSFQDKAVLDFNQPITGVVGPNGCGKSNVVDAIRWVMGEQSAKNLRGKSMEDIIFGGTEFRKPLGMAEVSLFFSTEDGRVPAKYLNFSEIQVTRRLYRDGDSDYLLNKTPCRLLDIAELFMDTGIGAKAYSIIEQGKIGMILHAKPEERRFLIEEAAGVTKFKARKVVAMKKMEATRQNLLRLGDIISEIKRQMNGLQRQAKKAERFREIRLELKEIELLFAAKGYGSVQKERQGLEREIAELESKLVDITARLNEAELSIEGKRITLLETERALTAAQEEIFRWKSELQGGENKLEFQRRELANQERHGARFEEELQGLRDQLAASERELVSLETQQASFLEEHARESEALEHREALLEEMAASEAGVTRELDEARRAMFAALSEGAQANNQHAAAVKRLASVDERLQASKRERVLLGERLFESNGKVDALKAEREQLAREKELLDEELTLAGSREAELKQAQEAGDKLLQQLRDQLSSASSRLKSLQELEAQFAGYGQGVKNLLLADSFKGASLTMLADAIEVEEEFEVALESVLGERLQYLLCGSPDLALDAVRHLKGNSGGRCSFITAPPWHHPGATPSGAAPLLERVTVPAKHAQLVEPLLSGAYLARDLAHALELAASFPHATFVTVDGDLVHGGGILNGGSAEPAQQGIIHKKREIKGLGADVERLTGEVQQLATARETRRVEIAEAEAHRVELRQSLHRLEIRVLNAEKDLQSAQAECRRLEENAAVREMEEEQLSEEQDLVAKEISQAENRRGEAEERKLALEKNVEALQGRLEGSRFEMEEAREMVTSLKVRVAALKEKGESTQRAYQRVEALCADLASRISSRGNELEGSGAERTRLIDAIAAGEEALRDIVKQQLRSEQALLLVKERYETEAATVQEEELRLKGTRSEASLLRDQLNAKSMRLTEVSMRLSHLEETLREKHRMEIADALLNYSKVEWDEEERAVRQAELQKAINEMGEVNLMAIEEFKEMEERFSFLSSQKDDLEESMNALQKAIQRINRTTRKRFLETFQMVNEKFQTIFPRLFCGGHAELRLTDEEDLLNTGLDIVVQPPGKKLQNVSLLSGGEKALTAVALIFSIFLIKPSPFCLLDEVDAPLDDANIGRFNDMVREMSANSQFIIITHNRATMAVADTLYGVTMEEPGVSKLVSVRLNR